MGMEEGRTFATDDCACIAFRLFGPPRRTLALLFGLAGNMTRWSAFAAAIPLAALLALVAALPAAAQEESATALRELFRPLVEQPGLAGLPIRAQVSVAGHVVDCDILAVVAHPAPEVTALLGSARGWCEFLLLHPNVKARVQEPAADGQRIAIHVGTKHFQPVELSRPQRYDLRVEPGGAGVWAARLWPEPAQRMQGGGPALIEAVGLDGGRTGVRLQYRETLGAGTCLLASGYFATFGRDTVGFSTAGVDAEGRPVLVGGLAGAIERNVVRHYLAIETQLASRAEGGMPLERRLAHWFALTERHARQLHELDWADYLDNKQREFDQSAVLQKSIDAQAAE